MLRARLPHHVGFIPDGNRRWAGSHRLEKHEGYAAGIAPGLALYEQCAALGIGEISIYGFTVDNTKRPVVQQSAFVAACIDFARNAAALGASLLVVGDCANRHFPAELQPWTTRCAGSGPRVNLLCNYSWEWDVDGFDHGCLRSQEVDRLDLIVRWGGAHRLSGFLPIQSVYADFFVVDELWPDYQPRHFDAALRWYARQDRTLGG
jgi:undecaprenyl diphosphate synthase